jgi:hypothetical protein
MLALFEQSCLIDDQHGLRGPQMLDHRGPHIVTERIGVPLRSSQQMLAPIRGGLAVDGSDLPAVFALSRAEEAPERRPGMPPGFTPRTLGANPSFHLGEPPRPCAHSLKGHAAWEPALLLTPLHGAVLQKVCGTMLTYDLQL